MELSRAERVYNVRRSLAGETVSVELRNQPEKHEEKEKSIIR